MCKTKVLTGDEVVGFAFRSGAEMFSDGPTNWLREDFAINSEQLVKLANLVREHTLNEVICAWEQPRGISMDAILALRAKQIK